MCECTCLYACALRPLAAQALRLLDNHVDAALELLLGERSHEMLVQLVSLMQTIQEGEEQVRAMGGRPGVGCV
jgi:hypothetical protein